MFNNQDTFKISPFHEQGKLNTSWSIWWRFISRQKNQYDSSNLQQVFDFEDLNTFSKIYNGSVQGKVSNFMPSDKGTINRNKNISSENEFQNLPIDCLMLFRKNIKPEWEDPKNAKGGHFMIELTNPPAEVCDPLWMELSQAIVGELWEGSEYITGLRMLLKNKQDKKYQKYEIWIEFTNDTLNSAFKTLEDQQAIWTNLQKKFYGVCKDIKTDLELQFVKWEPHSKPDTNKNKGYGHHNNFHHK